MFAKKDDQIFVAFIKIILKNERHFLDMDYLYLTQWGEHLRGFSCNIFEHVIYKMIYYVTLSEI